MPFPSAGDHPPRRNARSFDLDDSATKAAAWVWHLHESKPGVTTEGRFLSSQSRRRSSSSSDRKGSRFRQEAVEPKRAKRGHNKAETPMWDCGSNLYDTFELITFGNRLDRSLMEAVPVTPPLQEHVITPYEHHTPLHETGGVLRSRSLPQSAEQSHGQATSKKKHTNSTACDSNKAPLSHAESRELSFSVIAKSPAPKRWPTLGKLLRAFKKVVVLHKQMSISVGCKNTMNIVEPSQRQPLEPLIIEYRDRRKSLDDELLDGMRGNIKGSMLEGSNQVKEWRSKQQVESQNYHISHLHHHHHHHHHHYLHHALASESARLSPETMSQICAEKSWLA